MKKEDGSVFKLCTTCSKDYYKCEHDGCVKWRQRDGFCIAHHPDFIPFLIGKSKVACEFLDRFSAELKMIPLVHSHYDKLALKITGNEYKIPTTNWRVDGFWKKSSSNSSNKSKWPFHIGNGVIVEFHGHIYHGYQDNKRADELNRFGFRFGDLYEHTMERTEKLHEIYLHLGIGFCGVQETSSAITVFILHCA